MTTDAERIIFHQYALSPFSEKIRRIFAVKNIPYAEVEQPMWMPKPELTPLTGGPRRIPVMQIGADVYCDTSLIARELDTRYPDPPLYPAAVAAAAEAAAKWADRQLFHACVPIVFGSLAELLPPELLDDRKKMRPELDPEQLRSVIPDCLSTVRSACTSLETTLKHHPFLSGAAFTIADAAVFHCLWFIRNSPPGAELLVDFSAVSAWMHRLEAMGKGDAEPMPPSEALDIARSNEPRAEQHADEDEPRNLELGARVGICSEDLPSDVVEGDLWASTATEVVVMREDADLGRIAVHFPREGCLVRPVA